MITIAGYGYGGIRESVLQVPENKITIYDTFSTESAISMLDLSRGGLLLGYAGPMDRYLEQHPVAGLQHKLVERIELFFIVSKAAPNSEQVLRSLEQAFRQLQAE